MAFGAIVEEKATDPPTYLVELLFSFKGIERVEVPATGSRERDGRR